MSFIKKNLICKEKSGTVTKVNYENLRNIISFIFEHWY